MATSELALEIINLLGKAAKMPNELGRFLTDFTNATVRWIRPLFLIDGKEDDDFVTYKNDPESPKSTDSKEIIIAKVKKALNNDAAMQNEFIKLLKNIKDDDINTTSFVNNIHGNNNNIIQGGSGNTITNS